MRLTERHLADDEQPVYVTRAHWTGMAGEFVLLCLIWIAAAIVVSVLPAGEPWAGTAFYILLGLAVLASLRYWLFPLLKWRSKLYILTTKRIYKRSGFLTRSSRSIPLARVNDVSFEATLWERVMRYGTLTVQSASEQGVMTMRHVPQPEAFKTEIHRAVDEERRQD